MSADTTPKKKGYLDSFCDGASLGLNVSIKNMLPNLIFAYALMQFLTITNVLQYVEFVFRPVMMLFGLPGSCAPALLMAFVSTTGGLGIVANLFVNQIIDSQDVAVLLVGIMCMGASIQYIGRILSTSGVRSKFFPIFMAVNVFNAFIGMWIVCLLYALHII